MALTSCCCMSIRTASLVIGWLGLALSAISISSTMNRLSRYETKEVSEFEYEDYHRNRTVQGDVIFLSFSILNVLVTGLLINGITSNKHRLILPWLIVKGLSLLIIIPLVFLFLVGTTLNGRPVEMVASFLILSIIGFCCVCWMVVYSLFKELQANAGKKLTYFENAAMNNEKIPYQLFEKY